MSTHCANDIENSHGSCVQGDTSKSGVLFNQIATQKPVTARQTNITLLSALICAVMLGGYHGLLMLYKGETGPIFLPALSVCFPLIVLLPICGSLFQTEIGINLLVVEISMIVGCFLLILLHAYMAQFSSMWLISFFNAGLLEEILKGLMYLVPLWMGRIKYGYQLVYYAAIAGLMFGVTENVGYTVLLSSLNDQVILGTPVGSIMMGMRQFTTPLLHMYLTVLGSCLVLFTITGLWSLTRHWVACILAILIPAILHGTYDAFLLTNGAQYAYISSFIATLTIVSVNANLVHVREKQACGTSK
jgi:hypothetical protein